MKTKIEVQMQTSEGNKMWLPATLDGEDIYFTRDENHVHAWHCNQVKKNDYNVLKIKVVKPPL